MTAPAATQLILPNQRYALVLTLVLLIVGLHATGEELPGHLHEPLSVDESLTLAGTVDAALTAYPDTIALEARQAEAEAWVDRGGSWLSDRPSMMLRYQTDRFGPDLNLDEYEAGIELPLWNMGGRGAVRSYSDALLFESAAAGLALRWEVAGLVRGALWNVALAENDHELAEQALATADRLVNLVERRHKLGDVALSDVLLAQASHLEFQTALIEANAMLLDAERAYRTITGNEYRPEFVAEPLSTVSKIAQDHPALAYANAAMATAEAEVNVAERTANTGTSVLLGARRERAANGTVLDDSVGITLSIPFGGSVHRNTEISKAARAASMARAERNRQIRELSLAMHEAAHGLNVAHQNIEAANTRLELAERHQAMGELAYEKGEIELIDYLRMQATTIAARRQATGLIINEKRQTALYNQAVGVVP